MPRRAVQRATRAALLAALGASAVACSLAYDLEALSGGVVPAAGIAEAGATDAPARSDAATAADVTDAGAPLDAPADSALPGCTVKTSGPRPASSIGAAGSGVTWSSLQSAAVEDGVGAFATFSPSNDESQFLVASAFGFAIPAAAAIRGVTVHIRAKANAADPSEVRDLLVRLAPAGTLAGVDKADKRYTSAFVTRTYGSATDLWGFTTLTPAVVNGSAFGFGLGVKYHSTAAAGAQVDALSVSVTSCE